jgi:hypothetical protein
MIKTDSIASGVFDFHVTWSSHLMLGTFNALIDSGNCFRYIDRERETCLWTLNIQRVRVPHRVAHRLERRSGSVELTSVFPTAAAKHFSAQERSGTRKLGERDWGRVHSPVDMSNGFQQTDPPRRAAGGLSGAGRSCR